MPSVGEISAKFTADTKGFQSGVADAQAQTEAFNSSVGDANQQAAAFSASLQQSEAASANAAKGINATNTGLAKQTQAFNSNNAAVAKSNQAQMAMVNGQMQVAQSAEKVHKGFGRAVYGVMSFISTAVTFIMLASKINKASQLAASGMMTLGTHLAKVGAQKGGGLGGIATALGSASKSAGGFVSNAGGIAGLLGQVSKGAFNALGGFGKLAAAEGLAGAAMTTMGTAAMSLFTALAPLAIIAGTLFTAFKVLAFAFKSAGATAAMNVQITAMKSIFEDAGDAASVFARKVAGGFQMTTTEAAKTMSVFGAFLMEAGLSGPAAEKVSAGLTALAADMAAFKGIGTEEAMNKIQGGLSGMYRGLREVGIIMNDDMVTQEAYKLGLAKVGDTLSDHTKVIARLSLIQEQNAKVMGFSAKTAMSYTTQSKQLGANMGRLAEETGKLALPFVTLGKIILNMVVTSITTMITAITDAISWIGKLVGLIGKIPGVSQAFNILGKGIGILTGANTDAGKTADLLGDGIRAAVGEAANGLPTIDAYNKLIQEGSLAQAEMFKGKAAGTKDEKAINEAWEQGMQALRGQIVQQNRTNAILEQQKKIVELANRGWEYYSDELAKVPGELMAVAQANAAVEQSERAVTNALQGRIDADQRISDLNYSKADGAKKVAQAQRGVTQAIIAVADANYRLEQAQKKVDLLAQGPMWWEVTAAVDAHNKAIRDVTKAEIDYAQAVRNVVKAELAVIAAEEAVTKAGIAVQQSYRDQTRAILAVGQASRDMTRSSMAVDKAYRDETRAGYALADAHDAVRDANQKILDLKDDIKDLHKRQKQVNSDLQAALHKTASQAEKNATTLQEALSASAKAFTELGKSVQQSVASMLNPLKRFEADASLSAATIMSNLQRNLSDVALWQDNLKKIAARGFKGLAQSLAQLGPEAASAVADFATGSVETLSNAEGMFKAQGKALGTEAIVGITEAIGGKAISGDFVQGLKDEKAQISKDLKQANNELTSSYRSLAEAQLAVKDAEAAVTLAHLDTLDAIDNVTLSGLAYRDALAGVTLAALDVNEALRNQTLTDMALLEAQDAVVLSGLAVADALEGVSAANAAVITTAIAMNQVTAASSIITDEETQASRELDAATRGVADSEYALGQALEGVKDAKHDALQWQRDMNDAIRARKGADDQLYDSMISQATAAGELAVQTSHVTDANLQAQLKLDGTINSLDTLAQTLSPNDPVRKRLDDYILALGRVPTDIKTTLGITPSMSTQALIKSLTSPEAQKLPPNVLSQLTFDMMGVATGGVVTGKTVAMLAERGPEVVMPLDKLNAVFAGQERAVAQLGMNIHSAMSRMAVAMQSMAFSQLSTVDTPVRGGGGGGGVTWTGDLVVQGSVTTERGLVAAVREGLLKQQRAGGNLGFEAA